MGQNSKKNYLITSENAKRNIAKFKHEEIYDMIWRNGYFDGVVVVARGTNEIGGVHSEEVDNLDIRVS